LCVQAAIECAPHSLPPTVGQCRVKRVQCVRMRLLGVTELALRALEGAICVGDGHDRRSNASRGIRMTPSGPAGWIADRCPFFIHRLTVAALTPSCSAASLTVK